ncbi:MAG: hypothetical protein ACT4PJ_03515 [Gemmatimonadaceae bacterium]
MRIRRMLPVIAGIVALWSCSELQPTSDVSLAETLLDMNDALAAMREETALLQAQVDSLREQMARQDTVLRRLASMAGMPLPGP